MSCLMIVIQSTYSKLGIWVAKDSFPDLSFFPCHASNYAISLKNFLREIGFCYVNAKNFLIESDSYLNDFFALDVDFRFSNSSSWRRKKNSMNLFSSFFLVDIFFSISHLMKTMMIFPFKSFKSATHRNVRYKRYKVPFH